jgi:transposase InsO family protein
VKAVAETLGVARSNLIDRLKERTKPRRRYQKAQDAAVVPLITALVAARPTYGYRRITALLNRHLRFQGLAPANHKRVYRIMKAHSLLLARKYSERPEHIHDGKVIVMRSNLRWCSDGFEFTRLGMATSFVAPSSSTPMTVRSNRRENDPPDRFLTLLIPGARSRTPASAAPTSAT